MKTNRLLQEICLLLTAACVLASCSTTSGPLFKPVPMSERENQALIYIYRPDAFCAGGSSMIVYVDDQETAELPNNGYTYVLLDPGRHEVHVTHYPGFSGVTTRFTATAEDTYFVKWETECGPGVVRTMLGVMRNKQARTEIATARLQATFTDEDREARAKRRKMLEEAMYAEPE